MAQPQKPKHNKPNRSEGIGVEAVEAGGGEEGRGTGRDGGEGKERATHNTPSPPEDPAAGREQANRPEGRAIWPVRRERKISRSRSPRGQTRERRSPERPHEEPQ